MANPYEQFLEEDVANDGANPYAQFVAQPATPFERAKAVQDDADISAQAAAQERYMAQQEFARKLKAQYPQLSGPSLMEETPPPIDPYLSYRQAPVAPREEAPSREMGSGFSGTFKLGLLEDEETKRSVLADTLFPNDPSGIYRVGFDARGQPVYVGDDGKLHKIASGTARFGAQLLANSPEMVMGTAGAPAGIFGASLGASGAHGIKRGVAGLIFDEPQTISGNLKSMGTEAATAGVGEVAGRAGSAILNRGRRIDFTPKDMAKAEAFIRRMKDEHDIDIDLAQASGDRRLIAVRAYGARYPGPSANLYQAADDAAKGQFSEATDRILDTIATATPAEVAGAHGINAAELAITTARRAAEARVEPLYRAAYEAAPAVMDPAVIKFFRHPEFREARRKGQDIARLEEKEAAPVTVTTTRRLPVEPHPADMKMSVNEVPMYSVREVPTPPGAPAKPPGLTADQRRLGYDKPPPGTSLVPAEPKPGTDVLVVDNNGNIIPRPSRFEREKLPVGYKWREVIDQEHMKVPDLRELDYTKRGLDQMIESLKSQGKRQEARALAFQRNKFVEALDNLDIPEYKQARMAWKQELRDKIEPLEKGVVGVLAGIKDVDANKAAARLFTDPNLTPTMVQSTKAAIDKVNPAAWNELTRTWIAHQWDKAQRVTRTSTDVNTPGALHQLLFGTPRTRANTLAMLGPEQAKGLEGVMEAAEALKRTPSAGSNTFRDQETKEIFEGLTGAGFKVWDALTSPRQAIRTYAQRRAVEQATLDVTEGILDPTKRHKLKVILRMQPSTKRNILMMNVLGAETGKSYVESQATEGENTELITGDAGAIGQ